MNYEKYIQKINSLYPRLKAVGYGLGLLVF